MLLLVHACVHQQQEGWWVGGGKMLLARLLRYSCANAVSVLLHAHDFASFAQVALMYTAVLLLTGLLLPLRLTCIGLYCTLRSPKPLLLPVLHGLLCQQTAEQPVAATISVGC
jgi:hypothetical protein